MIYKDCPRCHNISHSVLMPKKWLCPYCGTDITDITPMKVEKDKTTNNTSKGIKRDVGSDCDDGICPVR